MDQKLNDVLKKVRLFVEEKGREEALEGFYIDYTDLQHDAFFENEHAYDLLLLTRGFLITKYGKVAVEHFFHKYKATGYEEYYEDEYGQCVARYYKEGYLND